MTDPEYRHLRREIEDLERDLGSLRSEVDEKVSELEATDRSTASDVSDLDDRLDHTEAELTELRAEHVEHDRSLGGLQAVIRQLGSRIALLERHLARSGGDQFCDVSAVDQTMRDTVADARNVDQLKARILPDYRRATLQDEIRQHGKKQTQFVQDQAIAVAIALDLATTSWRTTAHTDAGARFRTAKRDLDAASSRLAESGQRARAAKTELHQDEQTRPTVLPSLERAEAALKLLNSQVRGRLIQALRHEMLLPAWFTEVFGARPLHPEQQRWLDTAVDVAVYRILYDVTDPLSPLGPQTERSTLQGTRREQLVNALRRVNPNL